MTNNLYARTYGSDRGSDRPRAKELTQNSDLIDQIGEEFIMDSYNKVLRHLAGANRNVNPHPLQP